MNEKAPRERSGRSIRARLRGSVLFAVVMVAAVGASAAASATLSSSGSSAPIPLEQQLQSEIDALRASGLPASHPKVQMLQRSLDQLRAPVPAHPPRDPRGDVGALLSEAREQQADPQAAAAEAAAEGEPLWESGTVDCEPVPGLLSAAEVAGATCVSVPQPDGTSRYVALGADGVARIVLFGADGQVQRLPDTQMAAGLAPGTAVTATPEGDIQLAPPGQQPTVVDVG
jgi:hypothetical protein